MRKTPRPAPTVEIEPKEAVIDEFGSLKQAPLACYTWTPRSAVTIFYHDKHNRSLEDCVNMVVHEVNHWAQFMFLTNDEVRKIMKNYLDSYKNIGCPYIEWINPIKGGFDYEHWEDKFNRPYFDATINNCENP